MNKIKVIDLLNMISKGEEVPKKVKVGYYYYEYEENGEYINTENTEDLLFDFDSYYPLEQCLNVEAEVIEEDKKIEKIKNINCESFRDNHNGIRELTDVEIALDIITLKEWINKIIDKLNEEE